MVITTKKENETLLILFKDFTNFYNANSISKILGISHVGAQKIFKKLYDNHLIVSKKIGKSIIYKLRLDDEYVHKLITFLLSGEANNFKRWMEEFKELSKKNRVVMIYGSAIKNYSRAKDIDIMIVLDKKDIKDVDKILDKMQKILPKKIHAIKLTEGDLLKNLKEKNKAIVEIIKNAVVLHGQDKYEEIVKNVASF